MTRDLLILVALIGVICLAGPPAMQAAGENEPGTGKVVDPGRKCLFYLHGAWIEEKGLDAVHPVFGRYRYEDIVRAFSERGFLVFSEARLKRVDVDAYAEEIAGRIRDLMSDGVPPENITVTGHSKGGMIALAVASKVGNEKINYVILAGCGREGTPFGRGYRDFLKGNGDKIRGRILSLYDSSDRIAGTCREALGAASGVVSEEVVLHTGLGHGLFFSPDPRWVDRVVEWAGL